MLWGAACLWLTGAAFVCVCLFGSGGGGEGGAYGGAAGGGGGGGGGVGDGGGREWCSNHTSCACFAASHAAPARPTDCSPCFTAERFVYEFMLMDADPAHDDLTDGGFRARVVSLATVVGVVGFIQLHTGRNFRVHVEGTVEQIRGFIALLHGDIDTGYFATLGEWQTGLPAFGAAPPASLYANFSVKKDSHGQRHATTGKYSPEAYQAASRVSADEEARGATPRGSRSTRS